MGGPVSGHHCPRVDSEIFRTQERVERQGESDETFGKCNGESRCTSHTQSAPRRPARASRRPPRPCTPRPLRFPPPAPHPHPATASCAIFPPDPCRGVPSRRRRGEASRGSVVQTMHGGRCLLAVHPRVPLPPPDAPYSRRRASHTGAFLARRHVWFVIACVATRGCTLPPPAHPGRRRLRLRRACLPAAHHHHRPFARRSARLSARRPALRQRLVAVLRERVLFIERYRRGHLQHQECGSR